MAARMMHVTGSTNGRAFGAISVIPSAADKTDTAGVITPSPHSMHAPNRIRSVPAPMADFRGPLSIRPREKRAKTPPSPRLPARVTKVMYFPLTTSIKDQKISDKTPRTLLVLSSAGRYLIESRSAYSGLVPISPNTTPSAAMASAACPVVLVAECPSLLIGADHIQAMEGGVQAVSSAGRNSACISSAG